MTYLHVALGEVHAVRKGRAVLHPEVDATDPNSAAWWMHSLFAELAAFTPLVDPDGEPDGCPASTTSAEEAPAPIPRASSLRKVPLGEIHVVQPFSAIMDEILAFPRHLTRAEDACDVVSPTPALYLGSLVSVKNRDALIAHDCRHVLTVLDEEEAPYVTDVEERPATPPIPRGSPGLRPARHMRCVRVSKPGMELVALKCAFFPSSVI